MFHTCSVRLRLLQRRELPQKVPWALISTWMVIQIQLMILLRVPPLASWQNFSNDAALPPLLVRLLRNFLCYGFLLVIMIEDATSILGANIWPLSIRSSGIVHAVKVLDDVFVCELLWVID